MLDHFDCFIRDAVNRVHYLILSIRVVPYPTGCTDFFGGNLAIEPLLRHVDDGLAAFIGNQVPNASTERDGQAHELTIFNTCIKELQHFVWTFTGEPFLFCHGAAFAT